MLATLETETKLIEGMPFEADLEAMEAYAELERRRALVASGKSRIMSESEASEALRAAGCHV